MAKYADFVKKSQESQVDQELDTVERKPTQKNIPESITKRFDGKSAEEIMESYAELARLNSRQGEDLGKLRKTVDQLLELQSQPVAQTQVQAEPDTGVTTDDLYEDPEEAIGRVVKKTSKETSERVEALERELVERSKRDAVNSMRAKYPDWETDAATPEFAAWVQESKYRLRLAAAANQYDLDAATDLFDMWYEKSNQRQEVEEEVTREKQFRDATLETASPGSVDVVQTYSRSELLEKRIAAKHGDQKAERYLKAHANAINAAYEEGRITD